MLCSSCSILSPTTSYTDGGIIICMMPESAWWFRGFRVFFDPSSLLNWKVSIDDVGWAWEWKYSPVQKPVNGNASCIVVVVFGIIRFFDTGPRQIEEAAAYHLTTTTYNSLCIILFRSLLFFPSLAPVCFFVLSLYLISSPVGLLPEFRVFSCWFVCLSVFRPSFQFPLVSLFITFLLYFCNIYFVLRTEYYFIILHFAKSWSIVATAEYIHILRICIIC